MLKLILIVAIASNALLPVKFDQPGPIDFNDPQSVRSGVVDFLWAVNDGDSLSEFAYRTPELKMWYKTMDADPTIIGADSSLANHPHISQLDWGELFLDTANRLVMRTYYQGEDDEDKHRYAFHINDEGWIDGILYVPPVTKTYFPEWTDSEFEALRVKIDSLEHLNGVEGVELEPIHVHRCAEVMPAVQLQLKIDPAELEQLKK